MALEITDNNFKEILAEGKPVVIDFWAPWCGPCKMLSPIIDEVAKENVGKVKICKLDVDDEPAIAQRFGVMSIPTLIAFKDGKQLSKEVGVTSCEELMTMFG